MELTALPPELLYRTLDAVRERLRIHVKTAHENVLNALDTFGSDMSPTLANPVTVLKMITGTENASQRRSESFS